MSGFTIRRARSTDQAAAYYVCLKTGDHGRDGEPFYRDDPDAEPSALDYPPAGSSRSAGVGGRSLQSCLRLQVSRIG